VQDADGSFSLPPAGLAAGVPESAEAAAGPHSGERWGRRRYQDCRAALRELGLDPDGDLTAFGVEDGRLTAALCAAPEGSLSYRCLHAFPVLLIAGIARWIAGASQSAAGEHGPATR